MQGTFPALDTNGNILLETKTKISVSPNGNGGLYKALKEKGVLDDMKRRGVQFVQQGAVDNVLLKVADPLFIGFVQDSNAQVACKVLPKRSPEEAGICGFTEFSFISFSLLKHKHFFQNF